MNFDVKGPTGLPLRTVYVTNPAYRLAAGNSHLRFLTKKGKPARLPFMMIRQLVVSEGIPVSTGVLERCLDMDIPVTFVRRGGQLRGHLLSPNMNSPELRIRQVQYHLDPEIRLAFAKHVIHAKIQHSLLAARRYLYNHPEQRPALMPHLNVQKRELADVPRATSLEQLRGFEGTAAKAHFQVLAAMLRREFSFAGRNRRPPRDPVNAMLSYGYTLLARECAAILEACGFDSSIGFYHDISNGRASFALDCIEPLRPLAVDRLVVRLVNLGIVNQDHFTHDERNQGCYLNRDGRKIFLTEYEDWMTSMTTELTPELWAARPAIETLCESIRDAIRDQQFHQWEFPELT